MRHGIFIFAVLLSVSMTPASSSAQAKKTAEKSAYTLIENVTHKFASGLECDISVAMANDRSDVRVIRLDRRKGAYGVNSFAKWTSSYKDYGMKIDLDEEFRLQGAVPTTVQASFDRKDDRFDLVLKVIFIDEETNREESREKSFPLESAFLKDDPKKCLK